MGQPTVNVTSALLPPLRLGTPTVVSYQSFYDSLDNTLDALRAALASPATGLAGAKQIGLIGYSGGAIATE